MKLRTVRIEALTDGIFAIVMTIMIVSLSEVFSFTDTGKSGDLLRLFSSLGEDFIAYALSFIILGILWFEHHWQFHYIKHINPVLIFINIIWFMFLCLIPFTTMLMGNHFYTLNLLIIFELNVFVVFALLCIHWVYATHKNRLIELDLDKKTLSKHRDRMLLFLGLTLLLIIATLLIYNLRR